MHGRKLPRLHSYDYSTPGAYFVTICVKNRESVFGEIQDRQICINHNGRIIDKCWLDLVNHFNNIELDSYVIMPNHFHGIVIIVGNHDVVGNGHARSLPKLPVVIGSFKAATAKMIHETGKPFEWQKSYYDRIIRDEDELNRIREYITNNPRNWEKDEENIKVEK
jgi:putative transposase